MRNNSSLPFIMFIVAMFAIANGGISALIPLMIVYFIANSLLKGQDRRQQRNRRDYDRSSRTDRNREREDRRRARERNRSTRRPTYESTRQSPPPRRRTIVPKKNPYKQSGIAKFKEYDYDGAIEDFEKALTIDSSDISVHFNLACAYSLNENKDKSFYHLSKAVALGYTDIPKIQEHDALAYLRIQPEFEEFKRNGYRIVQTKKAEPETTNTTENTDLLEQLNRLEDLRAKGVLTEREFAEHKKKLMR